MTTERSSPEGGKSPRRRRKPDLAPESGRLRTFFNALVSFTRQERQAILYLLPLLILLSLLLATLDRPHFERSFTQVADYAYDSTRRTARPENRTYNRTAESGTERPRTGDSRRNEKPAGELFPFDPNTIDLAGLQRLGFTQKQAQGILNYRGAGKVFRKAADFAACHTVSDEMYARLAPYIKIAPPLTAEPQSAPKEAEQRQDAGVQPPDTAQKAPPPPATGRPKVNLNRADSALLVTVSGIGAITANRIIAYRARLGGFARPEQLAEIQGMNEQNFERILKQIFVDEHEIQKIDINFADPKRLELHPYITAAGMRKILKQRQLKGGWRTIGEMVEDKTLTQEEAARLAPYFRFTPVE